MSKLPTFATLVIVLVPLALTVLLVLGSWWRRARNAGADGPACLLQLAVRCLAESRRDWGKAMLAELAHVSGAGRWRFATGCALAALFPPRRRWPRFLALPRLRAGSPCGLWGIVLPPLSLPLLFVVSLGVNAWMTHDDFCSGELVPGLLGAAIGLAIGCMFAGIPLGIAAALRAERARPLRLLAPLSSVLVFGYLQTVQHLAANHL